MYYYRHNRRLRREISWLFWLNIWKKERENHSELWRINERKCAHAKKWEKKEIAMEWVRNSVITPPFKRVFNFRVKRYFRFLCTFPFVNIKTNSSHQKKQEQCENRTGCCISFICCRTVLRCAVRNQQYRNFPWNCLTVFLCCFDNGSTCASVFVRLSLFFYTTSDKTFIVFSWFDKILRAICLLVRVNRRWVCEWVSECVCGAWYQPPTWQRTSTSKITV